jgi:PAS domain S-box-containing protein
LNLKNKPSIDILNFLIDNHPEAMAISDLNGKILAINEKLAQIFGKSKEELIGTLGYDNIEAEAGKRRRKLIEKVIKTKKPMELIDKERGRWWKAIFQPIIDKDGNVIKIAYYIQDISEKKESEIKLKIKEIELEDTYLKLSTITENINVGLYYTDVNGNFLWANKKAAEIVGRTRKEMIGKNGKYLLDKKTISKKDYLKALKILTLVKLGKKAGPEKFKILQKDGVEKIIEIQAQKIKLHDENVIVGIVNDITKSKKAERKVKDSEEKFRMLSDQSLMGLGIIQEDNIKYANETITQITGYSIDEMYSEGTKILAKIILPEDLSFVQEQLQKKLAGDKDVIKSYSIRIITKTGELKWVRVYSKTIKFEGKNADFITFIDITDKKESEEKLNLLSSAVKQSTEGLAVSDMDGILIFVNKAFAAMHGYNSEELIGKHLSIFHSLEQMPSVEIANKMIKEKGSFKGEINHIKRNGKTFPTYMQNSLLRDDDGKPIGMIGTLRDITEIKTSEELLRNSEEKLRNIIHHSDNLYYIHDTKHKITYVSPQSKKIFGYNQEEMKIKWTSLTTDNPINKIAFEFTEKAINTGIKQKPYIIEAKRKNGERILLRVNESPLKDENGQVIGITGVLSDITELKKAESEIIRRKNYLQNVIDSTSEIIITIDSNHKIKTWNKSAEKIIGYNKKDVINKNILEIDLFEYTDEIKNFMESILNKKVKSLNQINIKTNYDSKITLSVSPSIIKDDFDNVKEIILICRDITQQLKIKEKLHFGHSYIIDDINIDHALKIFFDLLEENKGLFIGRGINKSLLKYKKFKDIKIFKLSKNKYDEYLIINNLEKFENIIENYIKKQPKIIFIDRIDYLISTYTFNELLKTLYRINDLVRKHKSIIILRINSNFLNENHASLFYEEFEMMPSEKISNIILSDDLIEIIKYINNRNNLNINVSFGDLGKEFNISKVTVKKRIEYLIREDLIYSRKIGKTKLLYLTEKGKKIIFKKR